MKLTFLTHDLYNSLIRQGFTHLGFRNKLVDPENGTIVTYEALTHDQCKDEKAIALNKLNVENMLQQPNHIYYVIVKHTAPTHTEASFQKATVLMA
jgi:hypothetical protein